MTLNNDLPPVVFHALRHTSITYKLKLSNGNIKAVQGDSGHARSDMVTDRYSHIIDEDRKENARNLEEVFFRNRKAEPADGKTGARQTVTLPEGMDPELVSRALSNPEMAALLAAMAKSMKP